LHSPYAYPIALSFMLTLAISMVCGFKRAGWFD
jgi:Mg2+ and Co2+ transporter CorA